MIILQLIIFLLKEAKQRIAVLEEKIKDLNLQVREELARNTKIEKVGMREKEVGLCENHISTTLRHT